MATNPTMLDKLGLMLALVMGLVVTFFGHFSFLPIFLLFLTASVIATKYGYAKKREMGLYEHERSWENVLANGLIPTLGAVFWTNPAIGLGAYIGSVAAITADKFASEIGVLGSKPRSLLTLRPAKKGESGCVSPLGTLMSFNGGLLIGLASMFLIEDIGAWKIITIGLIGFAGSFADSLVGVLEERGIGNKASTNMICALAGAILGMAFLN